MSAPRLVLGIESSCDEMAAAVLRSDGAGEIVSSVVRSQERVHRPYGGVVPELASREHLRDVSDVVEQALETAGTEPGRLAGVAATAGPGLLGSLLVGLSFGKAFAFRFGLPFVGVHHLWGHLAAAELVDPQLRPPYLGLVVSGGHTALYRIEAEGAPRYLGETRDDAVGEAFDKVAKLLGLPFPGGPALSKLAASGDARAIALPRPLQGRPGYDFSYSGLKTAVALALREREPLDESARSDLAASFEVAAIEPLVRRACRALEDEGLARLAVVGGVAANRRLRAELEAAAAQAGFAVSFPPAELCTDNAAMIAAAGARRLARGERDAWSLGAYSRAPLDAHSGAPLDAPPRAGGA